MRKSFSSPRAAVCGLVALATGCAGTVTPPGNEFCPNGIRNVDCANYPLQAESRYILPYSVGSTFTVTQGNCTTRGHLQCQPEQFSYDFGMPIGTLIIASRSGTVVRVESQHPDGNMEQGKANFVFIDHGDGTEARYYHLTTNGVLVTVGQVIQQGDSIGLSGNSGRSSAPHLHIEVAQTNPARDPVPLVFRNTDPHPNGLVEGVSYTAGAF